MSLPKTQSGVGSQGRRVGKGTGVSVGESSARMVRFGHARSVLKSLAETVRCKQPAILVPELNSGHELLAELHSFWFKELQNIRKYNNHMGCCSITPEHVRSRWCYDKIVTSSAFGASIKNEFLADERIDGIQSAICEIFSVTRDDCHAVC